MTLVLKDSEAHNLKSMRNWTKLKTSKLYPLSYSKTLDLETLSSASLISLATGSYSIKSECSWRRRIFIYWTQKYPPSWIKALYFCQPQLQRVEIKLKFHLESIDTCWCLLDYSQCYIKNIELCSQVPSVRIFCMCLI